MSMQKRCILPHPCNGPLYAATSFMERCGCTEAARQKLMDYVNHHNARRDQGMRFRKGESNDGE